MNTYLVWLEWPERCFRVGAGDVAYLKSLVPRGSRVVRARSERAFLRALPAATHAIVWNFRSEWFAMARRLRLLATPAAGRELVPTEGPPGVAIHFGGFHGSIMAESAAAFIKEGDDLFTMFTCTPSASGDFDRFFVKCRRVAGG